MYIARFDNNDKNKVQSIEEHLLNCKSFVNKNCDIDDFKSICELTALLHDLGKYSKEFQVYIEQQRSNPEKGSSKVTHSVQGAILLTELLKERTNGIIRSQQFLIEMIRIAVLSHHGLRDAIVWDANGNQMVSSYKTMRDRYNGKNPKGFLEVRSASSDFIPKIRSLFENGSKAIVSILKEILSITNPKSKDSPQQFGLLSFYQGLLARYNLSLLIDADRTDAASFENENINRFSDPEPWDVILKQWESLRDNLESSLERNDVVSPVDIFRREISEMCSAAANKEIGIFRLSAPTGSGKTRSALRFAVNHAIANKLKRIVYVAPFNSILEQNADVIRNFLDNKNLLLEHHCNYTSKEKESSDGEELDRYSYLTQSWDARIVATSAVQFLEALFSSDSNAIRHFHSLANSVIIFDEIQSLPIRCTELFNLAVNFLTSICKSSVVLCSATQPPIDNLKQNCLKRVDDIISDSDFNKYYKAFKRTKFINITKLGGYIIDELVELILEKVEDIQDCNSVLIIVNTKSNAKTLFQELKKHNDNLSRELQFERLFHLSTNMCPKHRKEVLNEIKRFHSANKRFICVSTQLIEAGVDISFPVVFRALAGLDSIIQAAGRCNRNAEREEGLVYIFNISQTEEKVASIEDIKYGQAVMHGLLNEYRNNPQSFDNDLSSPQALGYYYRKYYIERQNDTAFNVPELNTTLVDLLSDNSKFDKPKERAFMRQAFKTAGDKFEVISEAGKISLIVPYDENSLDLLHKLKMIDCRPKDILRQLQQYTISVSESVFKQLLSSGAIDTKAVEGLFILNDLYYDKDLGLLNNTGDIFI